MRDPSQTLIKVDIDKENNEIAIMNNGRGIPIEMHKEHGVYVPELIFGHMMTSSNYDDDEKKVGIDKFRLIFYQKVIWKNENEGR